jgi:hypothetical protein
VTDRARGARLEDFVRRWLLLGSAFLVASAGAGGNAWAAASSTGTAPKPVQAKAQPHVIAGHEKVIKGTKQVVRLDPKLVGGQAQDQAQARAVQPLVTQPPTAKINVTYIGFNATARAAFQAAVNIWQTQIHSTVPIDVVADWSNLTALYGDPNILGAAGPTSFIEDFPNAPQQGVAYPIALANAIAGSDQMPANVCNTDPSLPDASGAEIVASFNSAQTAWYLGVNGIPGPNQVDFESVVLHELGHGLGFVGSYDGLDPSTGNDTGKGYAGLSGDGQNLTVFDTFVADASGHPLHTTPAYASGTAGLGDALRGGDGGLTWDGAAGDAAPGGTPWLYAPSPYEEGSSFSHLDEIDYPGDDPYANPPVVGNPNALMTPAIGPGEYEHSVGPIVLGMFQDMGWPQSGAPASTTIGDYHVAAPDRLISAHVTSNSAPLHLKVAGVDGVPASGVKAAVVTVTEQNPTRAGIWSALPNCAGTQWPDSQNYQAAQTRTTQSVLPLDDNGNVEVSVVGSPNAPMNATVSVDLVGWYGSASGGVSYHPLPQKLAWSGTLTPTPVDLKILGVAGVPGSGVTAVAVSTGVGFMVTPGFVLVGPGGVNTIAPTVGYNLGEFTQNLAVVPVGTGSAAGKIRLRVNAGHAAVSMYVVGWYGTPTANGLNFHPAGPARLDTAPKGQDVTISGLPISTPVLLNIHLGSPTASGSLSAGPGGSSTLALVQEMKAKQNTSGRVIVTTNAAGQVRLHLSAGTAIFYTDVEGWFSAS